MSWEREELNSVIYIHTREEMIQKEFFNNFFEKRDFIKVMPIEMFCSVPYGIIACFDYTTNTHNASYVH